MADDLCSLPSRLAPRAHQVNATQAFIKAFERESRAQAIWTCGLGKTLLGPSVYEALMNRERRPLKAIVFAPSVAVTGQNHNLWFGQGVAPRALSVSSAADFLRAPEVYAWSSTTTQRQGIVEFLQDPRAGVIFSTYQSAHLFEGLSADLIVFDEAHRTVLPKGKRFSTPLYDDCVKATWRMFLTATPKDHELGYGMDNVDLYGPVVDTISYSQARQQGLVVPIKVVCFTAPGAEGESADLTRLQLALKMCISIVNEHHTGKKGMAFTTRTRDALSLAEGLSANGIMGLHFHGRLRKAERAPLMHVFREAGIAVATSAKYLSEGVDVPDCDFLVLVDPRTSKVDITQIVGRIARVVAGKEYGLFGIPIFAPPDADPLDVVAKTAYRALGMQLQALGEVHEPLRVAMRTVLTTGTHRNLEMREDDGHIAEVIHLPSETLHWDLRQQQIACGFFGISEEWADLRRDYEAFVVEKGYQPSQRATNREGKLGRWARTQQGNYVLCRLSEYQVEMLQAVPGWHWTETKRAVFAGHYYALRLRLSRGHGYPLVEKASSGSMPLAIWTRTQAWRCNSGSAREAEAKVLDDLPGWRSYLEHVQKRSSDGA